MTDTITTPTAIQEFIQRWENSSAAERAELPETLVSLGQVRKMEEGKFAA